MRLTARLLLWACVLVSVVVAGERGAPPRPRLLITPAPVAEWKAPVENVQHVLYSAARELWRFFPQEKVLAPIVVAPKGGPIVWYRRGLNGEYYVQLATGSTYWAQYAFQFAHEFCHILCGYTAKEKANKWFEESLVSGERGGVEEERHGPRAQPGGGHGPAAALRGPAGALAGRREPERWCERTPEGVRGVSGRLAPQRPREAPPVHRGHRLSLRHLAPGAIAAGATALRRSERAVCDLHMVAPDRFGMPQGGVVPLVGAVNEGECVL